MVAFVNIIASISFSLEVVRCIGACGLSPVMTVDEDIYRRVKPSKVGELVAKYREDMRIPSTHQRRVKA